jgi:hypothetical protein
MSWTACATVLHPGGQPVEALQTSQSLKSVSTYKITTSNNGKPHTGFGKQFAGETFIVAEVALAQPGAPALKSSWKKRPGRNHAGALAYPVRTSDNTSGALCSVHSENLLVKPNGGFNVSFESHRCKWCYAYGLPWDRLPSRAHVLAKIVVLSGKQYPAIFSVDPATISLIQEKFGELEDDFRKATGYGFDQLTQSEARSIANFKPASAVRDRITQEAKQAGSGEAEEADEARLIPSRHTDTRRCLRSGIKLTDSGITTLPPWLIKK